jgi:hypothetical protein
MDDGFDFYDDDFFSEVDKLVTSHLQKKVCNIHAPYATYLNRVEAMTATIELTHAMGR